VITVERVDRRCAAVVSMCVVLAGCRDRTKPNGKPGPLSDAPASATASASATAPSSAAASATATASATPASSAAARGANASDAGKNDCRIARGPVRLAVRGAVAMGPGEGGLLTLGTNKLGAPAWESPKFPDPPKQGAASLLPRAASAAPVPLAAPSDERTTLPACALAAGFAFCVDGEGAIHKRPLAGDGDTVVARGRRGTPVAAAVQGGHTFYAFLANQKTSEGVVVRAFAAVDDATPIPLSEDGSGATFVGLVARDHDVLAMYIDARTALTPIHARTLRVEDRLVRGTDAVVFIAGGAEGVVRGALGTAESGPAFLFVPGPHDEQGYGMVTLVVDGEPKDDLPGKWSIYPAAMTSSYLAATVGKSPLRVVRARPEQKDSATPQVLELGHVGADGVFSEKCVLAKGTVFSDLTVAVDEKGSLWVAYSSGGATWVEQRGQ
jgi:hypothetical protein